MKDDSLIVETSGSPFAELTSIDSRLAYKSRSNRLSEDIGELETRLTKQKTCVSNVFLCREQQFNLTYYYKLDLLKA